MDSVVTSADNADGDAEKARCVEQRPVSMSRPCMSSEVQSRIVSQRAV